MYHKCSHLIGSIMGSMKVKVLDAKILHDFEIMILITFSCINENHETSKQKVETWNGFKGA